MKLAAIDVPAGFAARRTAAGLLLTGPQMQIRCVERARPVVHPSTVLGGVLRPIETIATCEGELGVRTGDRLETAGGFVERELGMVIGDDFATTFLGATTAPAERVALARIVDDLTRECRLHLGVRRRRFLFDPPREWQGFSLDGFDAHYLAPGHPRSPGCLTVHAAVPVVASLADWWSGEAVLSGAAATFSPVPILDEPLIGPGQLAGRRVRISGFEAGRTLVAELTCLADRDYWYPIVMVSDVAGLPERAAAAAAVIQSIRPLTRRPPTRESLAAVHHWFR